MRSRLTRLVSSALIALVASLPVGCGSDGGGGGPTGPPNPPGLTLAFTFPATGTSRLHAFTSAGVFDYRCGPHGGSGMTGRVTVDAGSSVDSAVVEVGLTGLNFTPNAVTIKVGGYVRWVNKSGLTNHTVTYP